MDASLYDPKSRTVKTEWYCAFGRRPFVQVFITAEGVTERIRLAGKLDSVDGIEEAVFAGEAADAPGLPQGLPSPSEFNFVGELVVPPSAATKTFCVGVMCLLTALFTEQLTLAQLGAAKHPKLAFCKRAMTVLGCEHPLAHAVSGSANPPDPKWAF